MGNGFQYQDDWYYPFSILDYGRSATLAGIPKCGIQQCSRQSPRVGSTTNPTTIDRYPNPDNAVSGGLTAAAQFVGRPIFKSSLQRASPWNTELVKCIRRLEHLL